MRATTVYRGLHVDAAHLRDCSTSWWDERLGDGAAVSGPVMP